ncbi:kelch domain-containing protein 9-like [Gigantopelta aegis]|uniref:kelch domain-containing protein 9-like n=1 Tax=Gigantopelta aegis TaxID=1735272 RepID=UPI001B887866|nr:kelch domain-containing protein 9-like [Gigantopelta aegis]
MAASSSSSNPVDWEILVPAGPALAFHTGCVINNCLYIHGGVSRCGSTTPADKLYRLSLEEPLWNEVRAPGCPAISHHTCIVQENRYMVLIGGWNGKKRTGDIFVFDTVEEKWITPHCEGFPHDAGLSSHTATPLANGEILILGREGSLRIQRRTGNAFLLTGNVKKGFTFAEFSRGVTSRSGHTTNIIGSNMIVIGGRQDNLLELQNGFSSSHLTSAVCLEKIVPICATLQPMSKLPSGRKHHIAMSGPCGVFIHGGEAFYGLTREPVGDMYFIKIKPSVQFFNLSTSKVCRSGHICFTNGSKIFIHGGFTGKSFVCCDLYELKIAESPSVNKGPSSASKRTRSSLT